MNSESRVPAITPEMRNRALKGLGSVFLTDEGITYSEHNLRVLKSTKLVRGDHLAIAVRLINAIGEEDILNTPEGVYLWQPEKGQWCRMDRTALRKVVQKKIAGMGEEVGPIRKSVVDSVSDLLLNEIYRQEHRFNVGPLESVNCLNGELILINDEWQLQPHQRENYRTSQIPVAHNPKATAPGFTRFLDSIFKGDPDAKEKAAAVLEIMGYSLVAHCRHETFILLVGKGANGKSVLLSVMEAMLGMGNVSGVQPAQLGQPFYRAELQGKLANIVTEMKVGEVVDDAALKSIVSGEPVQVSRKYGQPFTLRPYATQWIATNHMPHVRDFSDGLFRRALVIEFNNQFKPHLGNCNPRLREELVIELPGILNLALNAYARAVRDGFTKPASSVEAGRVWRLEADQVAQFVEDSCETKLGVSVGSGELYQRYTHWASKAGVVRSVSQKAFITRLKVLGFDTRRTEKQRLVVGLRPTEEEAQFQ